MSAEDLDNYETDAELALYREYRDVIKLFTYVVETERRFYLANKVDFNVRSAGQDVYFDVQLTDAWVWDVYRSSRFVKSVRIVTFKDVNVEEVQKTDIDIPAMELLRPCCIWCVFMQHFLSAASKQDTRWQGYESELLLCVV